MGDRFAGNCNSVELLKIFLLLAFGSILAIVSQALPYRMTEMQSMLLWWLKAISASLVVVGIIRLIQCDRRYNGFKLLPQLFLILLNLVAIPIAIFVYASMTVTNVIVSR